MQLGTPSPLLGLIALNQAKRYLLNILWAQINFYGTIKLFENLEILKVVSSLLDKETN
jgi:hypothetical protein